MAALTRILSLKLNPTPPNLKPRSFSLRSISIPSLRLHPHLITRASSSDSDAGRVIEFEQSDPSSTQDAGSEAEGGEGKKKEKGGMLMSQKITLGYAVFMLAGGVMGFVKSGSHKSGLAGLISAVLLGVVYKLLPVFPTLASMLGLAMSGALTQTMFSRFRQSGKVFPAGVVCVVSFIMFVGYGHGIFRSH